MFIRSAVLSIAALAGAREIAKDEIKAAKLYDSGIKHMNNVALKMECHRSLSCIPVLTEILGNVQQRT
jgi:hypothetical protein